MDSKLNTGSFFRELLSQSYESPPTYTVPGEPSNYQFVGDGILLPPTPVNSVISVTSTVTNDGNLSQLSQQKPGFRLSQQSDATKKQSDATNFRACGRRRSERLEQLKRQQKQQQQVQQEAENSSPEISLTKMMSRKYNVEEQVRVWLKEKYIKAGVNVLTYEDVFGDKHTASLLPNGYIQADVEDGLMFNRLYSWIKYINGMPTSSGPAFFTTEIKRIKYKNRGLAWLMREYQTKSGKKLILRSSRQRISLVGRALQRLRTPVARLTHSFNIYQLKQDSKNETSKSNTLSQCTITTNNDCLSQRSSENPSSQNLFAQNQPQCSQPTTMNGSPLLLINI